MKARRLILTGLTSLCMLVTTLLLPGAATATTGHGFSTAFGSFSSATGIAVDDSAGASQGDIYVLDRGADQVDKFTSAEAEKNEPGTTLSGISLLVPGDVAVDDSSDSSSGDVYVTDTAAGTIDKFGATGKYESSFAAGEVPREESFEPVGVAVDPANGEVFVTDVHNGVVDVFTAAGKYVTQFGTFDAPTGIAVNAEGDAYVTTEAGEAFEVMAAGGYTSVLPIGMDVSAVSVAPNSGDVYLDKGSTITNDYFPGSMIEELGPNGEALDSFTWQESSSQLRYSEGVGVDSSTGAVYASIDSTAIIFTTGEKPGKPVDVRAETVTGTTATFKGQLEAGETSYYFAYNTGTACGGGSVTASLSATGAVGVSEDITGLKPDTQYTVCLSAVGKFGETESSAVTFSTSTTPPTVEAESFSDAGSSNVVLRAQIEAGGLPTTYFFEYGTSSSYGSTTAVASLATTDEPVSAQIVDLQPETVYHFRVVTKNADGEAQGQDEALKTFPATSGLPDGRIYEMVTPAENNDANAYDPDLGIENYDQFDAGAETPFLVSPNGEAVTFAGDPSPEGNGAAGGDPYSNQYVISRASGTWVQRDISPRGHGGTIYMGFSSDLASSVFMTGGVYNEPTALLEEAPAGYPVMYERDGATGAVSALLKSADLVTAPKKLSFIDNFAGGSQNYESLLLESSAELTPNAVKGRNLYQVTPGGQLELVNVLPDGAVEPAAVFGAPPNGEGGAGVPGVPDYSHDISLNGKRVFWSSIDIEEEENSKRWGREPLAQPTALYMHEPGAPTVQIDASQAGGPGGGGRFWTANADGSRVLFTDEAAAKLTDDTAAGSGENLYEYEPSTHQLKDLTPDAAAGVVGVLGLGEGEAGSYIYFAADGVLAAGASPGTCEKGAEGEVSESKLCNLYVWHDGVVKFIATVSATDGWSLYNRQGDWVTGLDNRSSQVTPDGQALLFQSRRSLTGYDDDGLPEVYVYDASTGELSCASCDPSGEPVQQTQFSEEWHMGARVNPSYSATEPGRWMSDDGDQVFFDSGVPLTPEATNGLVNVYEWERDGSGTCHTNGGCVSLLSNGKSDDNSYLYGTSESGNDTFFITRSQLVGSDGNENFNVFDARADAPPALAPAACSGTGCQGVPAAPPIFATPASVTFEGVGNFPAPAQTSPTTTKKAKAQPLTTAQRLAKALAACKRERRSERAKCKQQARKRYSTKSAAKGRK